jgi:hypothetical protein
LLIDLDIGGNLGSLTADGMEFGFDTVSVKIGAGNDGLRIQDADIISIYIKAAISVSNAQTTSNFLYSVFTK